MLFIVILYFVYVSFNLYDYFIFWEISEIKVDKRSFD